MQHLRIFDQGHTGQGRTNIAPMRSQYGPMSKEFGENKGIVMKGLGRGQNNAGKEHPVRHFEIAYLAATALHTPP